MRFDISVIRDNGEWSTETWQYGYEFEDIEFGGHQDSEAEQAQEDPVSEETEGSDSLPQESGVKRIDKPKMRLKLTSEVFDALRRGSTYEFDREWMPYSIVLENWGNLE